MEPQQESFDTFGRWMLTRLRADLAPSLVIPLSPLYSFFVDLYDDMLTNLAAYLIPTEPFCTFFARILLTPEESAQHEALKAARMRVRKVVFAYLEFLFNLGKLGVPVDSPQARDLLISRAVFERLVSDSEKKARIHHFISALERSGLSFNPGDPLVVSNRNFPEMPAVLASFSQACTRVKDFDFYLYRRCDLAVYDGKTAPDFADALRLTPQQIKKDVAETDERLMQMRFRREIFVDGGDMTYRVRYSKKGDQVVYWCRIQETFNADLAHYLRWRLDSDLTPRLFTRLDGILPGLANHVFGGLKPCAHCYGENCQDRTQVEWSGVVKEVCKGSGWNHIGYARADYERLWTVLETLNELVAGGG